MPTKKKKSPKKCSLCGREIVGTSSIKHMWKHHHAHMMKNRGPGSRRTAMTKTPAPAPELRLPSTETKFGQAVAYAMLSVAMGKLTKAQAFDEIVRSVRK